MPIEVTEDADCTYINSGVYVEKLLTEYGEVDAREATSPLLHDPSAEGDQTPADPAEARSVRKWVGGIGWLVVTTRPDLAYSHCRLSQVLSGPTHGTIRGIREVMKYLRQPGVLALRAPLHGDGDWNFWVDAGQAGNPLVDERLRPHLGIITHNHDAAIDWKSTLDSTSFANLALQIEHCPQLQQPRAGDDKEMAGSARRLTPPTPLRTIDTGLYIMEARRTSHEHTAFSDLRRAPSSDGAARPADRR